MQLKAPAHRIFTESLNFLPPKNIGYLFGNAKRLQKHFCFVVDKISDLVHTIKIAMFSTLRKSMTRLTGTVSNGLNAQQSEMLTDFSRKVCKCQAIQKTILSL